MQIQLRLITVALLSLTTFASANAGFSRIVSEGPADVDPHVTGEQPAGQDPKTVSVRSRIVRPQAGLPAVRATVDRKRVPLGDQVTFTLYPASVVRDPKYVVTLYFGDDKLEKTRKTEIVHLYTRPGDYTYSILVEATPDSNQRIPGVKLAASPTAPTKGAAVTFTAQLDFKYPNIKYRFTFGDGSATGWQDSSEAKHSYGTAGSYEAFVDVGAGANGETRRSNRQSIRVSQPPPPPINVKLTANTASVEIKAQVTFTAVASSQDPNLRYRFEFGDGTRSTQWQLSPTIIHAYSVAGTYPARAFVSLTGARAAAQTAGSNPVSIEVKPVEPKSADLIVTPPSVLQGLPVLLSARYAGGTAKTRYKFNFGDGASSDWQSSPQQTHIYSLSGEYPAFVEVGVLERGGVKTIINSKTRNVSVASIPPIVDPTPPQPVKSPSAATPTSSPSPPPSPSGSSSPSPSASASTSPSSSPSSSQSPGGSSSPGMTGNASPGSAGDTSSSGGGQPGSWWLYLLIALLILLIGYQAVKFFYPSRPTFHPNLDPGTSSVVVGKEPLAIDFQVALNPNLSGGEYGVSTDEGSLIRSRSRDDD